MIRFGIVLCLVSICLLSNGWAEEHTNSTEIMDTMVVTAGRVEEKLEDVTSNLTVIDEGEITQSSAHDLGDLLQEQGFMIREYPNSIVSIDIRGFKTNIYDSELESYVLILVDGVRSGTSVLNKINIDNVERVEIIRGPGSVQYGASAMGGVINVITKKGTGKPTVYVEQTTGSWDFAKTSAGGSGRLDNFDFSFNASTESQGDYQTAEGDTYYNTGFTSKDRYSFNTGWSFMPKNRIGISYTGYKAKNVGSPSKIESNNLTNKIKVSEKNKTNLNYSGQQQNGFLCWDLTYFYGENKRNSDPDNNAPKDKQQGGQGQITAEWDIIQATTGVDWTLYKKNTEYENLAAFILTKSRFFDEHLIISAAIRQDNYNMEGSDGKKTDDNNITPSLGMVYKINHGIKIRANYAEGFKVPSPAQLFRYNEYEDIMGIPGTTVYEGNPDLKPEKSKTWECGFDINRGSLSTGFTYFQTDFKDQIVNVNPEPLYWTFDNISSSTISGIEGNVSFDIGQLLELPFKLSPYATFTHLIEYKNDETGEDLTLNPEWRASFGLTFAIPEQDFVTKLNFAHFTDQKLTSDTTLDGYTVADLTISKKLFSMDKAGSFSLKADIRNLFNEDYSVVEGYPSPGRSFFVGLRYDY